MKRLRFLFTLLFVLAASTATLSAQVCKQAGNVEAYFTPDQAGATASAALNFANSNAFQVTVSAIIELRGEKEAKKTYKRTFVIPANGKRKFDFSHGDLGGKLILPRDCDVSFSVEKCEDK